MPRPGHPLGPPLTGNDLVRFDEAGITEELDVVMDFRSLITILDENAETWGCALAVALEMQEDLTNEIEIALHS